MTDRHQRRQHWKMSRELPGDCRTRQPSNAFCSFEESIKAFADYVLRGAGASPTHCHQPSRLDHRGRLRHAQLVFSRGQCRQ